MASSDATAAPKVSLGRPPSTNPQPSTRDLKSASPASLTGPLDIMIQDLTPSAAIRSTDSTGLIAPAPLRVRMESPDPRRTLLANDRNTWSALKRSQCVNEPPSSFRTRSQHGI
jgi:hypothetical protein